MDNYSRSALNTFAGLILNRKPMPCPDALDWGLTSGRALYVVVRGDEILFDAARNEPLLLAAQMLGECDQGHLQAMLLGEDGSSRYFAINIERLPASTTQIGRASCRERV